VRPEVRPTGDDRRRLARLKEVESRIATLEEELAGLSLQLEDPPADPIKVQWLGNEYVRLQDSLERLMEEWEVLHSWSRD